MTLRKLGMLFVVAAFTFSLFGCNSEAKKKDKLISYYKKALEFVKSDDFKKLMKESDQTKIQDKDKDFLKSAGLTDVEFKELDAKYKDDAELKKVKDELNTAATKAGEEMMKDFEQQMKDNPPKDGEKKEEPKTDQKQ